MRAQIIVIAGREKGQEFILEDRGSFTVGRSRENELSILDERASRKHCRIQTEEGGLFLSDLNSLNGTHLNGRMIVRRKLSHGDRFRAGSTRFEVLLDGQSRPRRGAALILGPVAVASRVLASRPLTLILPWLAAASVLLAVGSVCSTWLLGESKLTVDSSPPLAMVFIDGQYAGQTPLHEIKVPRGRHLVKVRKHGAHAYQTSVELGFRPVQVHAELAALPTGSLEIETHPIGAEVNIDGEYRGLAPKAVDGLSVGPHLVRISVPGYLAVEEKVFVPDGRAQKRIFTLKEEMVQFYEDQVQREPNNAAAFTELAHLHILGQRFEPAIEGLEAAFSIVSEGKDTSNYAARLTQEITKAYRADHYTYGDFNAIAKFRIMVEEMLERILDKYPSGQTHKLLLAFYQQAGRKDKIAALKEKLYHRNPNSWAAAKDHGVALLGAGNYVEAKQVFDKARKSYPGTWDTHYHYGLACLRGAKTKQDRADAVDAFETALRCTAKAKERTTITEALREAQRGM